MKKKLFILILAMALALGICSVGVFATDTTPFLDIDAANLSLESAVHVNFKITHENIDRDDIQLLIWEEYPEHHLKGTEDACVSAPNAEAAETVFSYVDLAAKDMAKFIYVCAYADVDGVAYYSDLVKYSITVYAYKIREISTDVGLLNLMDAMLNYGAYAQRYFDGEDTRPLATDSLYQINVNGGTLEDGLDESWYYEGMTATLTANVPAEGFVFSHWTNAIGDILSTEATMTVTVSEDETYTAIYKEGKTASEGLEYMLSEDETYYIVVGIGDCEDTEILIPSTYNGKPVKEIGEWSFSYGEGFTSIVIPEGVTVIGYGAFYGCMELESISIPASVDFMDMIVFGECSGLKDINVHPDNTEYRSVDGNLYSKNGETLIQYALGKTDEYFTVPAGVTRIGEVSFAGCVNLFGIEFPASLESIGEQAFFGCVSLTDVDMPEGLVSIENFAFNGCAALETIDLPDSLTHIGNSAFADCTSLESIDLPEGVENIGYQTFKNCTSLVSIKIPKSMKNIENLVFANCVSLETVYYAGTAADWENMTLNFYGNALFDAATRYDYSETQPTTIGNFWHYVDGVPTIWEIPYSEGLAYTLSADETYYIVSGIGDCKDAKILVPPTYNGKPVKAIAEFAFSQNADITDVAIPEGVTTIGYGAFYNCASLASVTIPEGVTTLEASVFRGCINLTSIQLPDSMVTIGWCAFYGCESLEYIELPEDLTKVDSHAFRGCISLVSIVIPDGMTSIGEYVFADCKSLASVTIPEGVTTIKSYAFYGCANLTSIVIPESVTSICKCTFYNCTGLTEVYYAGTAEGWMKVSVDYDNSAFNAAVRYHYSETAPTARGNFWHYVDGVPTKW